MLSLYRPIHLGERANSVRIYVVGGGKPIFPSAAALYQSHYRWDNSNTRNLQRGRRGKPGGLKHLGFVRDDGGGGGQKREIEPGVEATRLTSRRDPPGPRKEGACA